MSKYPSLQACDAFAITKSDTVDVKDDVANTTGALSCFIHVAGASGLIKVTTSDGTDVSVYGVQGTTIPLLVRRVWSTGTAAGNLIGFVGKA